MKLKIKTSKLGGILLSIVADVIVIIFAYLLAIFVAKVLNNDIKYENIALALGFVIIYKIIVHLVFGVYNMMIRYMSMANVVKLVSIIIASNILIVIFLILQRQNAFISKSLYLFITAFEIILLVGYRLIVKFAYYMEDIRFKSNPYFKRTLIIGAGSAGELALQEITLNQRLNNNVIGFLDDDKDKLNKTISNRPVLGPISMIADTIRRYNVEEVIMAIKDYPKSKLTDLITTVNAFPEVKFKKIAVFSDLTENEALRITDVKVEDLLDREQVDLDSEGLFEFINNETVLVTGGGGSIGSELCRQIFNLKPKHLVIFDIYENNAYEIQMELERLKFKDPKIDTKLSVLIGSVYNLKRLEEVFTLTKPTIVFHAAAYKHVPLMEDSPVEAIRTNVIGTNNLAQLSCKYNVKKFVLVSSDKAVRSTNVMGATKRYAELIISHYNSTSKTKFSAVRFGNVLGSNGSVIPLFKKQIEDGGPITVTHKDITRYFMTIPEAVGLILQSAVYADGGEIFILDMGQPVKIYDLAIKMIMLSGLKPNSDIKIEVVGLRPGEKLYEELLVDLDSNDYLTTSHSRIFIEKQEEQEFEALDLDYVINNYEKLDNAHIKKMLAHVVNSYQIDGDKNVKNS